MSNLTQRGRTRDPDYPELRPWILRGGGYLSHNRTTCFIAVYTYAAQHPRRQLPSQYVNRVAVIIPNHGASWNSRHRFSSPFCFLLSAFGYWQTSHFSCFLRKLQGIIVWSYLFLFTEEQNICLIGNTISYSISY